MRPQSICNKVLFPASFGLTIPDSARSKGERHLVECGRVSTRVGIREFVRSYVHKEPPFGRHRDVRRRTSMLSRAKSKKAATDRQENTITKAHPMRNILTRWGVSEGFRYCFMFLVSFEWTDLPEPFEANAHLRSKPKTASPYAITR